MPELSLEEELRIQLEDAYRQAMASQSLKRNPREMEQFCDQLEEQWAKRLEIERAAELRGAEKLVKEMVRQEEKSSIERDNAQTSKAISSLSTQMKNDIWHSTNRNSDRSRLSEHQLEIAIDTQLPNMTTKVNQTYDRLQNGMQQAIDCIREAKQPSLDFIMNTQIDKEFEKRAKIDKLIREANERSKDRERER